MYGRAVSVTMNHVTHASLIKCTNHFGGRDVHNVVGFIAVALLALHAHKLGDHAALLQGLGEHILLPGFVAPHGTELLILLVFDAYAIAMQTQSGGDVEGNHT